MSNTIFCRQLIDNEDFAYPMANYKSSSKHDGKKNDISTLECHIFGKNLRNVYADAVKCSVKFRGLSELNED